MYTSSIPGGKCFKKPFDFAECSAKSLAENGKEDLCKFPFTFRNKTYQACTYDYNPWLTAPQPWCSLLTGEWNFIIIFSPMFSVPVPGGAGFEPLNSYELMVLPLCNCHWSFTFFLLRFFPHYHYQFQWDLK